MNLSSETAKPHVIFSLHGPTYASALPKTPSLVYRLPISNSYVLPRTRVWTVTKDFFFSVSQVGGVRASEAGAKRVIHAHARAGVARVPRGLACLFFCCFCYPFCSNFDLRGLPRFKSSSSYRGKFCVPVYSYCLRVASVEKGCAI